MCTSTVRNVGRSCRSGDLSDGMFSYANFVTKPRLVHRQVCD